VTPTQLRAFANVVRLGSVKAAADEMHVSEAAVSMHVAQLRKELDDKLFVRTVAGLAFTPGGLRVASRAVETGEAVPEGVPVDTDSDGTPEERPCAGT
jgi:LysR family transcriptional regulator, low CO2-responsive transcriptional regulator